MNKKSIFIITIEIFILIILYIFINSGIIKILPKCWIYENTGIMCFACGGTRCIINLVNGNIVEAFFSHMVFFIAIIYIFILNIVYIINLNRKNKILEKIYPNYRHLIIFIIFLIIYTFLRNILKNI